MNAKKRRSVWTFIVLIALICVGCQAPSALTIDEHLDYVGADNLIIYADTDEEHDVNEVNGYEDYEIALEPKYEANYFWTWDRAELLNMQDINTLNDINIYDFFSSSQLSNEENVEIKEGVISILLYLFGHDVEEEDVFPAVDLGASAPSAFEDDRTLVDQLMNSREHSQRNEVSLSSIDTNFMMRLHQREDGRLGVDVLIFPTHRGEPGGSLTFGLDFEKIEGRYKLVWLGADS